MIFTQGLSVKASPFKEGALSKELVPLIVALMIFSLGLSAHAQWQDTTYTMKGGWNAIYLHGEATHTDPDTLFSSGDALNIEEIWRWNPDPGQIQFTNSPLTPSAGVPAWSVWKRGLPLESDLSSMIGQTAYLVKCSGTTSNTYSVTIKNKPLPPSALWVRNGANLIGFPSFDNGGTNPTITNYFATFPAATAANNKIYRYIGGDLGPSNPVQVFAPAFEEVDRNQAYWFEAEVTGSFYGPLEITASDPGGLKFGGTGSVITVRIRNRTAAPVTVTLSPISSTAAPVGEPAIEGDVPLLLRTYNAISSEWTETPITAPINEVVSAQSSIEVNLGIDRSSMTGASSALYASLLRVTDSGNLMDVYLPASASVASLAGLWVGEATVSEVESKVATSPGTSIPRSFPLRILMHVDDSGVARLLSQAFLGTLDEISNPSGICTVETALKQDEKSSARRITVAHMPMDRVIDDLAAGSSGNVALGSTLTRVVNIPYNDPTSPFVHQYHPDHDNKDARPDGTSDNLADGVESYSVERQCSFEFTPTPPAGSSILGWGSSVIGGNYTEVITGLHKENIAVSGTFILRRVSELGSITLN